MNDLMRKTLLVVLAHPDDESFPIGGGNIMAALKARLHKFGIEHTTIQFECEACGQGAQLTIASKTNTSQVTPAL